ncbi:MAG: DNA glycosylase [Tepidanaerobacteraceae bacterium]|jgi:N-glycosylase/DNA lyase|nr:DNA-3-methyladenine glycosylase 2 [Tepidanaerobacter sp.]HQE06160.1 DNA glycosylase [Tepidanaerobacteraceae bacterium]
MRTVLKDIHPFNFQKIADGGQAFRWNLQEDGAYIGVVGDSVFEISQKGDGLVIESNGEDDIIQFIKEYLDLNRNYNELEMEMLKFKELIPVVGFSSGYRILYQDPWETTISFIISANNHIRNIKNTIESICRAYGEPINYKGKMYYKFPSPEILAGVSEDELKCTKCGYRARYIIETAKIIADGQLDIYNLNKKPTQEVRAKLVTLPGVGRKVADCIMLYSMRKFDAFPIDVWIQRILQHMYFDDKKTPLAKLQKFAEDRFGEIAGFVQQYLFYYSRNRGQDIVK